MSHQPLMISLPPNPNVNGRNVLPYHRINYKAKTASAAIPSRPAAWVARAAAPGNSDTVGDGLPGAVPFPDGVGAPEAELMATVEVSTDVVTSVTVAVGVGSALGVSTSLDGAGVLLAPGVGTSTVTPASAQVCSTAAMVFSWSSAEQAPCTQGVTEANSESDFLQWQAKSWRLEQPSEPKGSRKQFNYVKVRKKGKKCEQWWETYCARRDGIELSGGDGGQSDKCSSNEGLHFG